MTRTSSDKFRALVSQENWDELIPVLIRLDPSVAADFSWRFPPASRTSCSAGSPLSLQLKWRRRLPYYDAYVLLHTRSGRRPDCHCRPHGSAGKTAVFRRVARAIVANPDERTRASREAGVKPAAPLEAPSVEPIIEARQIEKIFPYT